MSESGTSKPSTENINAERSRRIEELAEEFLNHVQAGENPDRKALLDAHPDIADDLDRRISMMMMIYQARPGAVPSTGGESDKDPAIPETQPVSAPILDSLDLNQPEDLPKRIGPYKALEFLGKGGMGVVYLADQTEPVRRRVALKLIKLGRDTNEVLARFESERQALALMDHPGIAKVFEAGATERGRPYFAMEHVPGVSVSEYCDRNRLSTKDRLDIFLQVCDAVQHAHHKAIIHRDLKPSNILVSVPNGKPVPKIIDFGVAKATNQRLTERTLFTELGQIIGTPEYMSPEQAEATALDVDTRTDIYSLGVILYELLTGALPFESKELRGRGLTEIRRKIREDEPPKPSTRVSTRGEDSSKAAERRRTNPTTLARLIRGDLDWITMKAMEKDRTRRYSSASELAADIQRHLNDEPVLAGPPSASYRLRKFVRKNRWPVIAAAGLWAGISAGLIVALWMGAEAIKQKEKATRAEKKTVAYSGWLTDLLTSVDPGWDGRAVTVAEFLDRAARQIDASPPTEREVEAELRDAIGWTYRSLGLYEEAEHHLEQALKIRRGVLGAEDRETLATINRLAVLLRDRDDLEGAIRLHEEALQVQRTFLGKDDPDTLTTTNDLAVTLKEKGDLVEAMALALEALEGRRLAHGPEAPATLESMHTVAGMHKSSGNLLPAEDLYQRTLELRKSRVGEMHPATLQSKNDLASLLLLLDRAPEAEVLLRETFDVARRDLGEDHPNTLTLMNNLGDALRIQGEWDEAEAFFRKVLEIRSRRLGKDHVDTVISMYNLAWFHKQRGEADEAERLLRSAWEILKRSRGERHMDTLIAMNNLASLLRDLERLEEAEPLMRKVVEVARGMVEERRLDEATSLIFQANYGKCLAMLGRFEEAEELLLKSQEGLRSNPNFGPDHRETQRVLDKLVFLYDAWGKPEKAERFRSLLHDAASATPK